MFLNDREVVFNELIIVADHVLGYLKFAIDTSEKKCLDYLAINNSSMELILPWLNTDVLNLM